MYLAVHVPMFGTAHIDSKPIECPTCPRGKEQGFNDWEDADIAECNPGQKFTCKGCGKIVTINWGLVEPDHLSNWMNAEHCPHRLCKIKFAELAKELGYSENRPRK